MRRWFVVFLLMIPTTVWAFRPAKPPVFTERKEWSPNALAQLNQVLEDIWNTLNGRYEADRVTTNPDGSRQGRPQGQP